MNESEIWVVIPTYNEAQNIAQLLGFVRAALPAANVLVVDDSSPDGTAGIVAGLEDANIRVLSRSGKQGLGRAYVAGFRELLTAPKMRLVIEMDADGSHDPTDLPRLVEASSEHDLVIGSRYVPGGRVVGWSRSREVISRAGNLYARKMLKFDVRDSTSGFRLYRRELLERLIDAEVSSNGYAFQIELTWRAWLAEAKIAELPITFTERSSGKSKFSARIIWEALGLIASWRRYKA